MWWPSKLFGKPERVCRIVEEDGAQVRIALVGFVSSREELDAMWAELKVRGLTRVVLDMGEVKGCGSIALASIVDYATALHGEGGLMSLALCPNAMLFTLGEDIAIEEVLPITSVRVDYLCPSCGAEPHFDFQVTHYLVGEISSEKICDCGTALDLDGFLEIYESLATAAANASTLMPVTAEQSGQKSLVGETILGQFEILEHLAAGATSSVYKAQQINMDRLVAIKVMSFEDSDFKERFRNEAKLVSQLRHPNVITVHSFGELPSGELFLAMEFIDGPTLRHLLQRGPIRPFVRLLRLARECLAAVAAAHRQGIVHRDLKPENLMIRSDHGAETLQVLDFGLAVAADNMAAAKGTVAGTLGYIPPELWEGAAADEKSDQYSLGLIIWEMLTGRGVLSGERRRLGKVDSQSMPSASSSDAAAHLLDPILLRMTESEPGQRYSSLQEVSQCIDEVLLVAGGGASVVPTKIPRRPHLLWSVGEGAALWTESEFVKVVKTSSTIGGAPQKDQDFDSIVLELGASNWLSTFQEAEETHHGEMLLPIIDDAVDSSSARAITRCPQGILGVGHEKLVYGVLAAMVEPTRFSVGQTLTADGKYLQLTSVDFKHEYMHLFDESLKAESIRSAVRSQIVQLVDELILNALHHAPPSNSSGPARTAPLLRWKVTESDIVVSVHDSYGTFLRRDLLDCMQSLRGPKMPKKGKLGMGLGLPLTLRHSKFVAIQVVEGHSTEVTALFGRQILSTPQDGNTLGWVWRSEQQQPRRSARPSHMLRSLGSGLWLNEETSPRGLELSLRGYVGESCDLEDVFGRSGKVFLDLAQVSGLNSFGIRAWVVAHGARSEELRLEIENCAPPIVDCYGNMGDIFLRASEIQSIEIPFICEACDLESKVNITTVALRAELTTSNSLLRYCNTCSAELELDCLPDHYFSYLRA